MIKRIRDKLHIGRPQETVSFEDWEKIVDRFVQATEFFKQENFIYQTLSKELAEAENVLMENRVKEVREEVTLNEQLKKIFITPKKVQEDELVGQIKFLRGLFKELQSWISVKEDLEKREANGITVIDRGEKNGRRSKRV